MSSFVHRTAAVARRVPWKNGRGVTEELAIGPAGASFEAGDFAWRVSRAAVVEAGPFSSFPGIDRVLVVTDGPGLGIVHGDGPSATLPPLVPHRFRGDDETTATLVGGPVRDFNVFARRGVCRADVEVVRLGAVPARTTFPPGVALLHAVKGEVVVREGDGRARTLTAGESLYAADLSAPEVLEVSGADGASAIVVRIVPAQGTPEAVAIDGPRLAGRQ